MYYYLSIMKKTDECTDCCQEKMVCKPHHGPSCGDSGAVYGMGVIGALFYFLQGANTFMLVMIGIGKAIFWPAFLLFKVLTMLQM